MFGPRDSSSLSRSARRSRAPGGIVDRRVRRRPLIPWTVRWRSALSRRARSLGLLLICLAALVSAVAPHRAVAAPEHEVLVAARDLPLGTVLAASDLTIVRVAAEAAPAVDAADRSASLGRRLAVPLRAGEYLPAHALVGTDLAAGLPEGRAAVGVRVKDPQTLQLLAAGSRIRVLGRTSEGQRIDVPGTLLWVPGPDGPTSSAGGLVSGSSATDQGQELALVSVSAEQAPELAVAAGEVVLAVTGPDSAGARG